MNSPWEVNIYAKDFVPRAITAINESLVTVIPATTSIHIDYAAYIGAFAGSLFLSPLPKIVPPPLGQKFPSLLSQTVTPETYKTFFEECLAQEVDAYAADVRRHSMYCAALSVRDGEHPLYSLSVPGVRDDSPAIILGQTVLLRQLILDPKTQLPRGMDAWCTPGGGYSLGLPAPGFTGFELQAVVHAIDKAHEKIFLQIDGLIHGLPLLCNVVFVATLDFLYEMHRAVTHAALNLNPDGSKSAWLHHMLFPVVEYGKHQESLPSVIFDASWYDKQLNHEQKVRRKLLICVNFLHRLINSVRKP